MRVPLFPILLAVAAAIVPHAAAQLTTIHGFADSDGISPAAALVRGGDGNFYGTAPAGGNGTSGTIYRLAPDGTLTVLYTFSEADDNGVNSDGAAPTAALVDGGDGNFYGTTSSGGAGGFGTVFRVAPDGTFSSLYSFQSADGNNPTGGLVHGSDGNFYGTTLNGGTGDLGTVYRIAADGSNFLTLVKFAGSNGNAPSAALVDGGDGGFYGTTRYGGANGLGTVFRVDPSGNLSTVYSFGAASGTNPTSALVKGSDGSFYGAAPSNGPNGRGTVFKVTAGGALTVLHAFGIADGASYPVGVTLGADGSVYGTANSGGAQSRGAVFRVTSGGTFTNLYTFTGGNDGGSPRSAPTFGSDGNLYGTTSEGGANQDGTAYRVSLGLHPAFFSGEVALSNGVYYLAFPNGNIFGYYSYLSTANYLYHQDLGYEYWFDAADGKSGIYFYDFQSGHFFYTSPTYGFPYLYDFSLKSVLYYYPNPNNPQRYNTNGVRYFYNFATGQIISQ